MNHNEPINWSFAFDSPMIFLEEVERAGLAFHTGGRRLQSATTRSATVQADGEESWCKTYPCIYIYVYIMDIIVYI